MKPRDIALVALRSLEDALAQAEHGRVLPQWSHRLALSCLLQAGIAEPWQCRGFWIALNDPFTWATSPGHIRSLRTGNLIGCLNNWWYRVDLQPLGEVERGYRAQALVSPIDSADPDVELVAMCTRYMPGERQAIMALFDAHELRQFNAGPAVVHPKDPAWVVRAKDGELVLDQMIWGFPVVLKGKTGLPLKPKPVSNARFDKLNAFWRRWATSPHQRCLIPTARFAEAVGTKGRMTETWLSVKDQPIFAWAGLWSAAAEWGDCFTGVMTSACSELEHIHDRSPVILERHQWQQWLTLPLPGLYQFDRPFPAGQMVIDASDQLWAKEALTAVRRRIVKPIAPMPTSIIAQVAVSGTALTVPDTTNLVGSLAWL